MSAGFFWLAASTVCVAATPCCPMVPVTIAYLSTPITTMRAVRWRAAFCVGIVAIQILALGSAAPSRGGLNRFAAERGEPSPATVSSVPAIFRWLESAPGRVQMRLIA